MSVQVIVYKFLWVEMAIYSPPLRGRSIHAILYSARHHISSALKVNDLLPRKESENREIISDKYVDSKNN
jgi:hypothetical protein